MRLLLDENMPGAVIQALREHGHDVLSAKESMRSRPDKALLERARRESRLVLTQDKDFGELAFRARLPAECGVMLIRLTSGEPQEDARRILECLDSRQDWAGSFAVVTDKRIRIRPLPPAVSEGI